MTTARASLKLLAGAALLGIAAALAGCQTTGGGSQAAAEPAQPPMTHTRAAEECWMGTEKGRADIDLDKRADIVDKCIDAKMKAAKAGVFTGKPASAKKP